MCGGLVAAFLQKMQQDPQGTLDLHPTSWWAAFEDDDRTIAFFCHLGLGNVLLSHLTGVSLPVWWHNVFLPPSSVTTVYTEKHDPAGGKTIMRLVGIGDTSHLFAGGEPISWSGLHSPIR